MLHFQSKNNAKLAWNFVSKCWIFSPNCDIQRVIGNHIRAHRKIPNNFSKIEFLICAFLITFYSCPSSKNDLEVRNSILKSCFKLFKFILCVRIWLPIALWMPKIVRKYISYIPDAFGTIWWKNSQHFWKHFHSVLRYFCFESETKFIHGLWKLILNEVLKQKSCTVKLLSYVSSLSDDCDILVTWYWQCSSL